MSRRWILTVDLGTGGPKTAAVALDGEVLATSFTPVETEHTADGGATQDVAAWWSGIGAATRAFVADGVVDPRGLHAVGLTGQFASTVPVDEHGRPVSDCLMWSDTRGAGYSQETVGGPVAGYAPLALAAGIRYACGAPPPTGEGPQSNELYLRRDRPEIWARTATLLEPADYLALRCTGRAAATPASMCLSFLVDTRPGRPRRYVPELARRFHRDPARLPRLHPTGSVLGPLLPDVADELGVAPGAPVLCGAPDKLAGYLGSGAVGPRDGHLAISSTGWISCSVPFRKVDPVHSIVTIPGVDDTSHLVWADQLAAGSCLQWWREQASPAVRGGAPDERGPASYDELVQAAGSVAPGSNGVMFLPWLHGELVPFSDSALRAGFVNLSPTSGHAAMTRAVLEGVALNTRAMMEAVERFVKRPFPSLRIIGGGARSDLWCQIMADTLGVPVEQVDNPAHAQLRGMALLARVSLGELSLAEAAALVPVAHTFQPRPPVQAVYDEAYVSFRSFYRGTRGTYRRLHR